MRTIRLVNTRLTKIRTESNRQKDERQNRTQTTHYQQPNTDNTQMKSKEKAQKIIGKTVQVGESGTVQRVGVKYDNKKESTSSEEVEHTVTNTQDSRQTNKNTQCKARDNDTK